ncbi:A/G-specific adenine glycosylase [Ramlibacter sp. H39-3-26]|uniref:A/G-specific adenine glycosylase n=1 Tax=Curvibacter soli TaxID=3031331 RepID=UPI0023DC29CD|nr:A/G-specific adenine glycosylase [Ramlibacter sp. H39-3-26]MDF1484275.1 A/G-specific adenine glycosylase [Ramlibacter sp. H39-3-26]
MMQQYESFADAVVRWQAAHGRNGLPWQQTRDPYCVWLSEIMLQQTQVATVLAYFPRFVARFPDVHTLAAASGDEVLGLWSGLGYYSRARNLHRCAQRIVAEHGGQFPLTAEALQTLPGIGRSTAAAIAAFCFGERAAILDANVKRVLTRMLGFDADLADARNERLLWAHATDLLPATQLADAMPRYTQGLMDLGATVCLPRKPACLLCPVRERCTAHRQGQPERYPVKTRKLRRSSEAWWMLLVRDAGGRVWLERRPSAGIWAGLHCLPTATGIDAWRGSALGNDASQWRELPAFVHVLTHKDLHLHPVLVDGVAPHALGGQGDWFSPDQWQALGLPAPVRRLLQSA